MKLCQLDLLRYGHLSDVALSFPDNVRLHVVHGVNEAGKSTALAAVADALFGFGHRTDFDFLHGAPNLRVGFTLSACDGAVASFVRRKGRRDTLRDVNDQAVPDEFLRSYLGGASRDQFERGFGLDGARLREGGRELLRLGGEVGESLLAGAGLLNLRAALARLDDEAKSLVGDGRGRRRLSDAADVWRQAQRETEERAVRTTRLAGGGGRSRHGRGRTGHRAGANSSLGRREQPAAARAARRPAADATR